MHACSGLTAWVHDDVRLAERLRQVLTHGPQGVPLACKPCGSRVRVCWGGGASRQRSWAASLAVPCRALPDS